MPPGRISTRLTRIPPFTDPRVRKATIQRKAQLGRARRRAAERLGSDRWSHPSLYEMDRKLEFEVPGRTLTDVPDEAGVTSVDLVSLDVEGYEASALQGLDVDRFAPRLVLVEVFDRDKVPDIECALGPAYRLVEELSPVDVLHARSN